MNNLSNSVQLIGRLGGNPELRELKSGKKIVKFSIATNDIYTNEKGEKIVDTQWHNIVAWGATAEHMEVLLRKGNKVVIKGKLQHRSYDDSKGVKRYISEISTKEFLLLNNKRVEA